MLVRLSSVEIAALILLVLVILWAFWPRSHKP
jgi:cbb3-type cytochrome oxidase subunit 3